MDGRSAALQTLNDTFASIYDEYYKTIESKAKDATILAVSEKAFNLYKQTKKTFLKDTDVANKKKLEHNLMQAMLWVMKIYVDFHLSYDPWCLAVCVPLKIELHHLHTKLTDGKNVKKIFSAAQFALDILLAKTQQTQFESEAIRIEKLKLFESLFFLAGKTQSALDMRNSLEYKVFGISGQNLEQVHPKQDKIEQKLIL